MGFKGIAGLELEDGNALNLAVTDTNEALAGRKSPPYESADIHLNGSHLNSYRFRAGSN